MPIDGDGNLEVAASKIIARLATGDLKDASVAEILTLLNVSAGAEVNPDVVSQAEAEAGTATTERIWTAERVKQAIDALASGAGDMSGPASSVDNRLMRFDGITGKLAQQSGITVDDTDNVSGVGNITLTGTVDGRDVAADGSKLDGIEAGADVTDTTNVTAAGALMDSEVDADIKTLSVPANTTISAFGATLVDDADAATARATLGVDAAGTDNSTDVTLSGTPDYITITGQVITRNLIDLTADVTGFLPTGNIADGAVTLAKMANMATASFIGRTTAATGVPEVLSKTQALAILNVEDGADVTDTANVTAAGALMDSEVDADIKTLALPANTTISAFGASLVDDANAAAARTTLDVDQAGTDNSTDVTLAGTPDYITLSGQTITRNQIDLTTDVTGALPAANIADEYARVLKNTPTQAGTTAVTSEEDLLSYTLPGGTLANTGDAIRVVWKGVTANNTNLKTLRFYWDGVNIYDSGAVTAQASQWIYECTIWRTGAATQDIFQTFGYYNGSVITPNFSPSLTATLSTDTIVKCTGQNGTASANDIINHSMEVYYIPAA